MAGMVAASEPSLHSLAPKGPSGSMLSTMKGSISGDSTDDGLRYSSRPGFMSRPSFQTISSCSAWPSPHPARADDLPLHRNGIQGASAIVRRPDLVHNDFAGFFVHAHFRYLRR